MSEYDKDYFEDGIRTGKSGYENYRWLPERLYREARALINLLGINPKSTVLDFGCAKGYLVRALREYNIRSYGCDISDYAVNNADRSVREFITKDIPRGKFDFVISRNTLEHLEELELERVLKRFLDITDRVFFTVPLINPSTGDYVMQMPDPTHKVRWTNAGWLYFAEKCGWPYVTSYPLVEGFHDNYKNYHNAMGFYVLSK